MQLNLSSQHIPLALIPRRPSLIISGASIKTTDRAIEVLEKLSNSLFFEIDMRFNLPLGIARKPSTGPRFVGDRDSLSRKPLQFPSSAYDKKAISLYWYGRTAVNMPLLRFLALYQTIEFYFPVYAQREAIKYVRGILKDPTFGLYDDKDVARLISALQAGRPNAFGDERSQLRATLQGCLDAEELRSFFNSHDKLKAFYTSARWKDISTEQVLINKAGADLRNDVADRLYDIRCKIVHTKSDGGSHEELLLPFSKEADLLGFDIELAQYVARRVLITSSGKLSL